MKQHTQGPWRVDTTTRELENTHTNEVVEIPDYFIKDSLGLPIAHLQLGGRPENAHLIAAAPELLAWTKELLAQLTIDHPNGMNGIKEHVLKLIERAEGLK